MPVHSSRLIPVMSETIPVKQANSQEHDTSLLTVDEALKRIMALATPISETETLAIRDALDHILAEPIISPLDVPPHANSAMDGYAVRAVDTLTQHGQSMLGADSGRGPVGRNGIGDQMNLRQTQLLPQFHAGAQMADMNGIKGATENADCFQAALVMPECRPSLTPIYSRTLY